MSDIAVISAEPHLEPPALRGDFSLMGVLWAKIGASPSYQTFTGGVELLAAVLLFIPGLTTVGALVALAVTTQVFVFRAMAQRSVVVLQLVFAAWVMWSGHQSAGASYATRGPAAPKPPLYGIWNIDRMTIDGVERAPLVTDYDRWRRLVVQVPGGIQDIPFNP